MMSQTLAVAGPSMRPLSAAARSASESGSTARAPPAAAGGWIAVVSPRDVGPRDAGDVALQIGREWKVGRNAAIGDSARNAGVVILLVPKETSSDGRGKFAIETGQGAEGFLTDADAGTI